MEKIFRLKYDYLYIPVFLGKEEKLVSFECEGKKLFEFKIPIGEGACSYVASVYAPEYAGKEIKVIGDYSDSFFSILSIADSEMDIDERYPSIHFSAKYGWINDPNGLVYDGNHYHMYFQHNPFNISWENMSWGHAVSTDLLHWEQKKDVLFPDENGTIFSGCGLKVDDELWFAYTVAGATSPWSEGKPFYQGLAISTDGGNNLEKQPGQFLGVVGKDSRDPKIFWHGESEAYIMVLYLEDTDFGIFRSNDLKTWEQTQRFSIEKAWECPDLLRIQGPEGDKWMFWSSDGYYYWGEFDGFTFNSEFKRHEAYAGGQLYATQTYSGVEDRIIAVPWLRLKERNGINYQGAMGIPREYSYEKYEDDYRLIQTPVKEFFEGLVETNQLTIDNGYIELDGINAVSCRINYKGSTLTIDYQKQSINFDDEIINYPFDIREIQIVIDYNILEISISNTVISAFRTKYEEEAFSIEQRGGGYRIWERK